MLTRAMERYDQVGEIHQIRPTKKAAAYTRRRGRRAAPTPHDLILYDLSQPNERSLSTISEIAFGSTPPSSPVVLLTSLDSEYLLESDTLTHGNNNMFAPTSLCSFLRKMREHSSARFLRALSVLSDLGPVVVRLPEFYSRNPDDVPKHRVA